MKILFIFIVFLSSINQMFSGFVEFDRLLLYYNTFVVNKESSDSISNKREYGFYFKFFNTHAVDDDYNVCQQEYVSFHSAFYAFIRAIEGSYSIPVEFDFYTQIINNNGLAEVRCIRPDGTATVWHAWFQKKEKWRCVNYMWIMSID
jgi:hypothetical protein